MWGWWEAEFKIFLHCSSYLSNVHMFTKFHRNRIRNTKVSIFGWWRWDFGGSGIVKIHPKSVFLLNFHYFCLKLSYIPIFSVHTPSWCTKSKKCSRYVKYSKIQYYTVTEILFLNCNFVYSFKELIVTFVPLFIVPRWKWSPIQGKPINCKIYCKIQYNTAK